MATTPESIPRCIAVFGSSDPPDGTEPYELAMKVGKLLAQGGFTVITGGYGGVMEGASRGAFESGGLTIGITTHALDPLRPKANPFLTQRREEQDLFLRTRALIVGSAGYIILPGRAGTLAELTFLWALRRAGLLEDKPIVLLGVLWSRFLELMKSLAFIDIEQLAITHQVDTAEAAVEIIRKEVK